METIATELIGASGINATTLYAQVGPLVPVIIAIALFVFGLTMFKKLTKGAAKGKLKM